VRKILAGAAELTDNFSGLRLEEPMHVGLKPLWGLAPRFRSVAASRAGSTAIEYALIGVLVGVVILASIQGLGSAVSQLFNSIGAAFAD
jgi:Flp pilus assembly pilin Flp